MAPNGQSWNNLNNKTNKIVQACIQKHKKSHDPCPLGVYILVRCVSSKHKQKN